MLGSCSDSDRDVIRGRGLHLAQLSAASRAHVYEAALRAAFHVDDPALVLLIHPRVLPRTARIAGGDPVPDSVVAALKDDGVIRGRCDPRPVAGQKTPRCDVTRPGYVVRLSDVLQLKGDTVEVFLAVTTFDTPSHPKQLLMQFENVYQIAKTSAGWTAIREGRVPKELQASGSDSGG